MNDRCWEHKNPKPCAICEEERRVRLEAHRAEQARLRSLWDAGALCRECFGELGQGLHVCKRVLTLHDIPKPPNDWRGPEGRGGCVLWVRCGQEVGRGRKTWCGDACVNWYLMRNSSAHLRDALFNRDHGVCALCGLETEELRKLLERRHASYEYRWGMSDEDRRRAEDMARAAAREAEALANQLRQQGFSIAYDSCSGQRSLWDADHVVPLCEGGSPFDLANLRTLCVPCHKGETAKLAARRSGRAA